MTRALTSALGLRARRTRQGRRLGTTTVRAGGNDRLDLCVASGWQLRHGCTDGLGHGVCPACAQPVRMRAGHRFGHRASGHGAWVVDAHRAA